jgi:hypothetical protein
MEARLELSILSHISVSLSVSLSFWFFLSQVSKSLNAAAIPPQIPEIMAKIPIMVLPFEGAYSFPAKGLWNVSHWVIWVVVYSFFRFFGSEEFRKESSISQDSADEKHKLVASTYESLPRAYSRIDDYGLKASITT